MAPRGLIAAAQSDCWSGLVGSGGGREVDSRNNSFILVLEIKAVEKQMPAHI